MKEKTDRFEQIIQSIKDMKDTSTFCGDECKFGVSRVYKDIAQVREGYVEAKKTITLKKSDIVNTYFYNDLGVNRLLLLLIESKQLENYVHDYLDVILSYDQKYESDLFTTLCIYLECNGVKNETADRLFIVRQTLYNRLEKLETLLGSNFMEPSNRLALEVAIKAYQILLKQNNNEGKPVFLV